MPTSSPPADDDSAADIEVDEDDQVLPPDPTTVSHYLAHLYAHNNDVRSHLMGSPQTIDDYVCASYFAPSAYWTTQEKDQFFHALSVHSRLRPDLIAEEIGTKTLADICTYIDMIEDGLKRSGYSGDRTTEQIIPEYLDCESVPRGDFPIAYEVCDEWVDFEETLAEAVIAQEPDMVADELKKAREEEARQLQLQIRARKGSAKLAGNTRDREGEKVRKKRFKEWLEEKEKAWKEEDALNSMDVALMKTIDMLLRERDEARALVPREGPAGGQGNAAMPEAHLVEASDGSVNPPVLLPKAFDDLDEELIDPSPRASSSAPTVVQTSQPEGLNRSRSPEPSALNPHDNLKPRTPPFPHLRPTESSSTLIDPEHDILSASSAAASSDVAPSEAEALLSPASRRRLMKRMYMRRKRAEKTGEVVDRRIARLKPGRKPMKLPGEAENENEPTRHPRPSGKPLQAKKKEELNTAGITAEWLEQGSLDLFHFGALYKLMRTYQSLHDVPDAIASEISIHALRLLRDELVQFISRIVQHVIVSREQEMKAKMHTKVWRLAGNQVVTAASVSHAVSLLGLKRHDKKAHFQSLLPRLDLTEEDFVDSEDDGPNVEPVQRTKNKQKAKAGPSRDDIESEGEATSATLPPLLQDAPIHRIVFPPFVRLPGTSTQLSDSMLPYIPWAHGLNADEPEDVPDVDEEAEDAAEAHELLQEEELDKRDRAAAKLYEDRLFEELGVHQEKRTFTDAFGTWDVSRVEKTARRLLTPDVPGPKVGRKRRRTKTADGSGADRKRQRVKTTEFVQDSDDEGEDLDKEDGGTDEDENAGSGTKDEGEEGEGDENAGASEGAEEGEEGEGSEQDDE